MENKLFSAYLVSKKERFSEKSFGKDVLDSFSKKRQAKENMICKDFINFFQTECETAIDSLGNFFDLSREERLLALKKFKQRWIVQHVYTDFLLQANYREAQKLTSKLYTKFSTQSVATVRSPSPLSADTKRDIRKHFPHGVIFEIHPDLVGGILLYQDGKIIDNSFASFFSRIPSLSS